MLLFAIPPKAALIGQYCIVQLEAETADTSNLVWRPESLSSGASLGATKLGGIRDFVFCNISWIPQPEYRIESILHGSAASGVDFCWDGPRTGGLLSPAPSFNELAGKHKTVVSDGADQIARRKP